uniref:Uncharacterized protein n=1 Tax=Rhipicephalus zambeziensis TaxID=60191 RepID=A0A224Y5N8_9ACAR
MRLGATEMLARLIAASAAFTAPARPLLPAGRTYDAQGVLINLDFIRDMTATATAKTRRDCPYNCYRNKTFNLDILHAVDQALKLRLENQIDFAGFTPPNHYI